MSNYDGDRIIGKYVGNAPGPLVICLAGMHGNEPAGVRALELLFKMIEVEPITNPEFEFIGTLVGIAGNLQALQAEERFIERDLNRSLEKSEVSRIMSLDSGTLVAEDLEVYELIRAVEHEIMTCNCDQIIVVDLHTTTASGGIFVLASEDERSIQIGIEMHAPVITGLANKVKGTTMEYFAPENFGNRDLVTVVFESGQHQEPLSINRAIAAVINVLRTCGSVPADSVENRHDYLLREYSLGLPKVAELLYRYHVDDPATFHMNEGFKNFQPIHTGETLATHDGVPVNAESDGLILMPKYQVRGNDGFFVVKALDY